MFVIFSVSLNFGCENSGALEPAQNRIENVGDYKEDL